MASVDLICCCVLSCVPAFAPQTLPSVFCLMGQGPPPLPRRLGKATARMHLVEGLLSALAQLDEVVQVRLLMMLMMLMLLMLVADCMGKSRCVSCAQHSCVLPCSH